MSSIQVGLIGSGPMGRDLANGLAEVERARLVAVCDARQESADKLADDLGVEAAGSIDEMLERDDIDAVMVATPPFTHCDIAIASAKAGKHLFVEKPMAVTVGDCDAMSRAVRDAGVHLAIGLVCRYYAVHCKVREMVHAGKIGRPVFMQVHRTSGPWGESQVVPWRLRRAQSGGSLMEINAHEIDFMRSVCGEVASVSAAGGIYLQTEGDYPDLAAVTLNFESGAVGFLHSSHVTAVGGCGGQIDGTEGSIRYPLLFGELDTIEARDWNGPIEIGLDDREIEDAVVAELAAWIDAVIEDRDAPVGAVDGRAAVAIAEAAYRSIESGRPEEPE
ncbi:MAG: hypothetical protein CMJ18_17430 [Phycisphaeraceae bacterium]|nr:hypothetical protein [Phycisphaeraceae bacterium]